MLVLSFIVIYVIILVSSKRSIFMKTYEIQPTYENLISTFQKDAIGRNESLFHFLTLLNELEKCTSIALEGYWGSGKTFFVKQSKMLIEAFNPFSNMCENDKKVFKEYPNYYRGYPNRFDSENLISQVPVYYDAWANDNDDDPIFSIVFAILNEYTSEFDFKETELLDDSFISIVNELLSFSPIKFKIPKITKTEDMLKTIKKNNDIHKLVEEFLDGLLAERGERLVVFVDELDRCKPDYAVRFLERIKHYFNNDRITFVFSINIEQLQHTIKKYYGNGFNATRYLDRFFDYRISLPKANMSRFYQLVNFQNDSTWYSEINQAVIVTLDLELRELSKFLMQVKIAIWNDWEKVSNGPIAAHNGLVYCSIIIVPIIIGLRLCNSDDYKSFISGKNVQPLIDVFNNCGVSEWILTSFINDNEELFDSASSDSTKKIRIKKEDILKRIYDYVIGNKFSITGESSVRFGKILFYSNDREKLLNKASLISNSNFLDINKD